MKMSDMNQAEFDMFEALNKKLGIQTISTEDLREAIDTLIKNCDEEVKEFSRQKHEQQKYLQDMNKLVTKLGDRKIK